MACKKLNFVFFALLSFSFFFTSSFAFATEIQRPVIIVPGMLASFNKPLMNEDKSGGKWGFVFGGNYYKDLIKLLKKNGYEEGKTLFIAYYDWRKSAEDSAKNYLVPIVKEAKEKSGKNKVDIIAHSMGGLVSRSYIQSSGYGYDVLRLVMLGTPNLGAGSAYVAWEGGEYPNDWNFFVQRYVGTIEKNLKKTHNKKDLTRPQTFREFFPGLKDLLPIYSFTKKDGVAVTAWDRKEQNTFLNSLSNGRNLLKSRDVEVTTISGAEINTLDKIYLTKESDDDKTNLRWRDGKPIDSTSYINTAKGDKTVLFSSASLESIEPSMYKAVNVEHVDLPNFAREEVYKIVSAPKDDDFVLVFFELSKKYFANIFSSFTARAEDDGILLAGGIESASSIPAPESYEPYVEPDSVLGFTVSPNVTFEIIDPDGKILSRDKNDLGEDNANFDDDPTDNEDIILVTIRNPKVGKYTLKITGNTSGDYYVDSTYVNDNGVFDDENTGTIKEGEEKTLEATVSETTGVNLPSSETDKGSDDTTTTDDNNTTENKTGDSSGANTFRHQADPPSWRAKNVQGSVLGTATVRVKLSALIFGVKERLTREIASAPTAPRKDERRIGDALKKKDYILLIGPVNEMLSRARAYETALATKKAKVAAKLLQEIKGDYGDFVNKVEKLIATGKLNQQTVNVLTTLVQRLGNAGLR
ncbi:MAG: hypothetical protein Q7S57_02655 [bacterium]|nr:hypothetical protein [bacterium]